MTHSKADLLQGTLVLKSLGLGPLHGYCIEQQGWVRSRWGPNETGRKARFYTLTRSDRRQLAAEEASWDLLSLAIARMRKAT